MNTDKPDDQLYTKLNLETAQLPWTELQRYFAGGNVIVVSDELDLIDVAARIAADDKDAVAAWLETSQLEKVTDAQAKAWVDTDTLLWTVVVKPWILVQQGEKMQDGNRSLH
jgi:hypothetical protein